MPRVPKYKPLVANSPAQRNIFGPRIIDELKPPSPTLKSLKGKYVFGAKDEPPVFGNPGTPITANVRPGSVTSSAKGIVYNPKASDYIPKSAKVPKTPFLKGASNAISSVAPYVSNIVNSFRKAPKPSTPVMNNYTNLSTVNLDNERNMVGRSTSAADITAGRELSSNTANAIKAANLGTKLNALSTISERETNANSQIRNQQAIMDMNTGAGNTAKMDGYNQSMVERNIAQQTQQSANLANAADKYIGIQNEKEKRKVDMDKTRMSLHAFDNSGTGNALRYKAYLTGEPDPTGQDYADIKEGVKRKDIFGKYGGRIPMKKLR